ncbi:MAG: hypothetical protein A2900_01925 [Candidatus Chisholmbacteria bacterium RIFCSPLOWO2_01_FULL_50_28]|uniref:SpoVT-AbrB domain-containing protein n=1 Tax=Candidatus Chisholmbacteria bacterium RIFCSPHIGHO2_01_FULL_52_32 TaxID=1797591 RepID=A0A1G1VTQ6_9BACT|nr:MAG: hypothetical protein A2786_04820 [Candidatus Chisholmbacteria bacterium RIFCSPHIGHO2_01_FULL_52_32]OGY19842.1 MAG: hypothetical protein A2900_01925 [Candidatus Chisholmbacteria bacterium RIFCSPLOWO2_01_FULL_50_28]
MTYTLTLSSQGQVVIPSEVRKKLRLKPGSRLVMSLKIKGVSPKAILEPEPESWVAHITGLGKGIWGKGEEYIEKERKGWK